MSAALVGLGAGALAAGRRRPLRAQDGARAVGVLLRRVEPRVGACGFHRIAHGVLRFLTGLGLGAAMPNAVTLMSEYAPARIRSIAVNTMFCGFSVGLSIGGLSAAWMHPALRLAERAGRGRASGRSCWRRCSSLLPGIGAVHGRARIDRLRRSRACCAVSPATRVFTIPPRVSSRPMRAPASQTSPCRLVDRRDAVPLRNRDAVARVLHGPDDLLPAHELAADALQGCRLQRARRGAHDVAVSARRDSRQPVSRLGDGPRQSAGRQRVRVRVRRRHS